MIQDFFNENNNKKLVLFIIVLFVLIILMTLAYTSSQNKNLEAKGCGCNNNKYDYYYGNKIDYNNNLNRQVNQVLLQQDAILEQQRQAQLSQIQLSQMQPSQMLTNNTRSTVPAQNTVLPNEIAVITGNQVNQPLPPLSSVIDANIRRVPNLINLSGNVFTNVDSINAANNFRNNIVVNPAILRTNPMMNGTNMINNMNNLNSNQTRFINTLRLNKDLDKEETRKSLKKRSKSKLTKKSRKSKHY